MTVRFCSSMLNFLFIRVYTKLTSIFIVAADRISQRRSNTKSLVGRVLSACRTRIRSVYLIVDAGGLRSYLLSCRAVTSHRRISFFFSFHRVPADESVKVARRSAGLKFLQSRKDRIDLFSVDDCF